MQTNINKHISKLQNIIFLFFIVSFIEPLFELGCLALHNFVFYHIAGLEFSGVSIGSLLGFLLGFSKSQFYYGQYLLMMPIAAFFAVFLIILKSYKKKIYLANSLFAATYILILITIIIFTYAYKILHISNINMLESYIFSALYWYICTSLSWVVLVLLRLL